MVKDKTQNERKWFRIDNSATIYPMTLTYTTQSLFRLSCELMEYVDKDILEQSLNNIMLRFPTFKVMLKSGFFRHYFDYNPNPAKIYEESGALLSKINFKQNNEYLFRVTYYKRKIFIDFFHALCDGTAAMEFLKSLIYQYLYEKGENVVNDGSVRCVLDSKPLPQEQEDSFLKHYKKFNLFGGVINKMTGSSALPLKGKKFKKIGFGTIQGTVDTKELLLLSKKYNATVTSFLSAVVALAVAKLYCKEPQKYPIKLMIPINLRRFFESDTLLNFTMLSKCSVDPKSTDCTVEEFVKVIKKEMETGVDAESLRMMLSFSSFMDKYWYMKYMPLILKTFVTKIGKLFAANTKQTLIFSNIGVVKMPESTHKHINKFMFNLNCAKNVPNNMAVASFKDNTVISFTRQLISTELEKEFFTMLSAMGLKVSIISNLRETTDALQKM